MQKIFRFFISLSIFLSACGDKNAFQSGNKNRPSTNPTDGGPKDGKPARENNICYLIGCYQTVLIENIVDPDKDYVYPDHTTYPDEEMQFYYLAPYAILDIQNISPESKIAPHFTFSDFMSTRKGRYALFSPLVVTQMQALRDFVKSPVFINSAYRSPGYNNRTPGSANWSRHTYGDAVDFTVSGKKISELTKLCEQHGATFTLTYKTHIHCDWRKSKSDSGYYEPPIRPDHVPEVSVAARIAQQSSIVFAIKGGVVQLSTFIQMEDDSHEEGDLTHEWSLVWPNGVTQKFHTPTVTITQSHGTVDAEVLVGGSILLRETIQW